MSAKAHTSCCTNFKLQKQFNSKQRACDLKFSFSFANFQLFPDEVIDKDEAVFKHCFWLIVRLASVQTLSASRFVLIDMNTLHAPQPAVKRNITCRQLHDGHRARCTLNAKIELHVMKVIQVFLSGCWHQNPGSWHQGLSHTTSSGVSRGQIQREKDTQRAAVVWRKMPRLTSGMRTGDERGSTGSPRNTSAESQNVRLYSKQKHQHWLTAAGAAARW